MLTLQNLLNLFLLVALGVFWREYRKSTSKKYEMLTAARLNVLDSRAQQMEEEVLTMVQKMEKQYQMLLKICEKARQIVQRAQDFYPASEEEKEFKAIENAAEDLKEETKLESIPVMAKLAKFKNEIQQKTSSEKPKSGAPLQEFPETPAPTLDLKTILREQLS